MPAKFLTLDEIQSQRDCTIQIRAENVERFYMQLGKGFDNALCYVISIIKSIQNWGTDVEQKLPKLDVIAALRQWIVKQFYFLILDWNGE